MNLAGPHNDKSARGFDRYWGKASVEYVGRFRTAAGEITHIGGGGGGGDGEDVHAAHHLFAHHSLDVAATMEVLLHRAPAIQAKLRRMLDLGSEQVTPFCAALAAIHDLGKLDWRFAMKARRAARRFEPSRPSTRRARSRPHAPAP